MPTEKAFKAGSEYPALEPGTLRLYSMRFCPFAQRTRILLAHKGIEYETVNINLKSKPEWFLEKAPLGTVPVIEKDDVIVYDSPIVGQYLDETYPGEKVTPADPYQRAKDAMFLEIYTKKVVGPYYKLVKLRSAEAIGELLEGLDTLEKELKARDTTFFGGETIKMVDIMMWPHIEQTIFMGEVKDEAAMKKERFPVLLAWIEAMKGVPAVKATMCPVDTFVQIVVANAEGKEIYDIGLEE